MNYENKSNDNFSEYSSLVEEIELESAQPLGDDNKLLSLARNIPADYQKLLKTVVQCAHLLPEDKARDFNALVLEAPYGRAKYRIGLLRPLSPDHTRRLSRSLGLHTTSETVIKFQLLDGMMFEVLMREAYEKRNLIKTKQRQEQLDTRQKLAWGSGETSGKAGGQPSQETVDSIENLAGKRVDISNLDSYFELKNKLDSGEVTYDNLETFTFVTFFLQDFILSGASDLHVHSLRGGGRIRYRFQGRVYTRFEGIPSHRYQQIVNSLCTLAAKDPSKMKQSGIESVIKLTIQIDGEVKAAEFRFQSLATLHNPSIILRGQAKPLRDITKVGFLPEQLNDITAAISNERGIVVVTGPTGSGKTNTLNCIFAILEEDDDLVISEIGSPIEIESPRRLQINIQETPSEKMTDIIYQKAFKEAMRSDPDIIGFTEIRNSDEARIAFRAAVTGHLVFTTLHAADVEETFGRLFEMGIDRSIIAKGILAIVAQTLIRKLCELCRIEDAEASEMAGKTIYRANDIGCAECDEGYKGRTVVAEVLRFNEDVQKMINEGFKPGQLAKAAVDSNLMIPMKRVALSKLNEGVTSESEVENLIGLKTEINSDIYRVPIVVDDFESEMDGLPVKDAEFVDLNN